MRLDLKDRKILALLDTDCRMSNSQIAKRVRLSKPAVEYRLERFARKNIVFSYYTVIDFTKLGYSQYKIYFKLQNATLADEQSMLDYFSSDKNSVWVAAVRGRWDIAVSILARSNFEFGKILSKFNNKFSKFILEKTVLLTEYSPIYSNENSGSAFVYGVPGEYYEIDEIDRKILKELATNARINIVNLCQKTKLTRDVVNYRMKKLIKDKLIVQFRCYLNFDNIGKQLYKVILRTKNMDSKKENVLKEFVSLNKKSVQFLKLIGSWDIELEFEVDTEDELYLILQELRNKFSDVIRDYDILRVVRTLKYDYFPF